MPLSLAELRAACETKTKMRCDGYPRAMFVHQVFEAEREVSLGFKKGKGGYFEQADFEDVLGEWGADEPRVNRMVFIGRNLNRKELEEGFRACLAKD